MNKGGVIMGSYCGGGSEVAIIFLILILLLLGTGYQLLLMHYIYNSLIIIYEKFGGEIMDSYADSYGGSEAAVLFLILILLVLSTMGTY